MPECINHRGDLTLAYQDCQSHLTIHHDEQLDQSIMRKYSLKHLKSRQNIWQMKPLILQFRL